MCPPHHQQQHEKRGACEVRSLEAPLAWHRPAEVTFLVRPAFFLLLLPAAFTPSTCDVPIFVFFLSSLVRAFYSPPLYSVSILLIFRSPACGTNRQRVGHLRRGRGHHLGLPWRRPGRRSPAGGGGDDEHGVHGVPARRHSCTICRGEERLGAGPRSSLEESLR